MRICKAGTLTIAVEHFTHNIYVSDIKAIPVLSVATGREIKNHQEYS